MIIRKINEAIPRTRSDLNLRNRDFKAEFNSGTTSRDEIFNQWTEAFNKANSARYSSEIIKMLVENFGSDMLNAETNPFLPLLINGKSFVDIIVLQTVIQLLGAQVLSTDNFADTSSIIYDKNIWNHPFEEIKYYCQIFYWLKRNGNQLFSKLKDLTNDQYNQFIKLLYNRKNVGSEDPLMKTRVSGINDIIYYKGSGDLNSARDIQNAIAYLDGNTAGSKVRTDLDVIKEIELTDDEKGNYENSVGPSVINKAAAQKLIKYLVDKYEIKL
jgi:hypothetical protein